MTSRTRTAAATAVSALALLAVLMFAPIVFDAPRLTLTSTAAAAENHVTPTALPSMKRAPAQHRSVGGYPLRRRRRIHFWNNWTHYGGRGGPVSWLLLAPLLAIIIVAVALPLLLRARRRRKQAQLRRIPGEQHGLPGPSGHPLGGLVHGADGGDPDG
ncbi:MAG: hypothetical protein JOZ49_02140 [Mycolicibacterium sp.]|nr:hypothetical protein [Mycolicibacterium sp.]